MATWLNSIGVTGILLKYRVPRRPDQPKDKPPIGALQDAQRALSLVRGKAKEWDLDPKRIGILGFSAGGHLAASAATNFDKRAYESMDDSDKIELPARLRGPGLSRLPDRQGQGRVGSGDPRPQGVSADFLRARRRRSHHAVEQRADVPGPQTAPASRPIFTFTPRAATVSACVPRINPARPGRNVARTGCARKDC